MELKHKCTCHTCLNIYNNRGLYMTIPTSTFDYFYKEIKRLNNENMDLRIKLDRR